MLWNFNTWTTEMFPNLTEPDIFVGAKSLLDADADKLLTQTMVAWWIEGYPTGNRWRGQRPFSDFAGTGHAGTYFTPGVFGGVWPSDLPINAGFMDGSVQRFIGEDCHYHGYPGMPGLYGMYFYDQDNQD